MAEAEAGAEGLITGITPEIGTDVGMEGRLGDVIPRAIGAFNDALEAASDGSLGLGKITGT